MKRSDMISKLDTLVTNLFSTSSSYGHGGGQIGGVSMMVSKMSREERLEELLSNIERLGMLPPFHDTFGNFNGDDEDDIKERFSWEDESPTGTTKGSDNE